MDEQAGILSKLDGVIRFAGRGLIVLGLVAIVAPVFSGEVLIVVLGLILILAGGLAAAFGLHLREEGKGSGLLLAGVVTAIAGLILLFRPGAGLAAVGWVLIPYLLVSGVAEAGVAMRLRQDEGRGETLASAIVSLLAGMTLLTGWPISGARAIGLLVGVKLIASGFALARLHRALESAGRTVRNVGDKLRSLKAGD